MVNGGPTAASSEALPPPAFDLRGESAPMGLLFRDLRRSVSLIRMLARKEFFVRYRRASFGVLWSVFLPLIQAVVLAAVVGRFTSFGTGSTYVVFVFTGTLAWNFLMSGVTSGVGSIVDNNGLSSKIYFPRLVFPIVNVLSGVYGTVVSLIVLFALTYERGARPGLRMLYVVPAMALAIALTVVLGALLGAMQVYFRDVRYIVVALQTPWFYLTPVIYPLAAVGQLATLIRVNPATGIIELFRAATIGADAGAGIAIAWSVAWIVVLFLIALLVYRRYDRVLVDLL